MTSPEFEPTGFAGLSPADAGASARSDKGSAVPLTLAADLQDHLLTIGHDLDRLQRLLDGAADTLMSRFLEASASLDALAPVVAGTAAGGTAADARRTLSDAVTALQFQDMSRQLIEHTGKRLQLCSDLLAQAAFGREADEERLSQLAPLKPNPVTQDEMDAGSVELF